MLVGIDERIGIVLHAPASRQQLSQRSGAQIHQALNAMPMVWGLSDPKPSGAGSRWYQAQKVLDSRLKAVTRVDGTVRAQTVSREQNPRLFQLLTSFKAKSGGVPCNTSLNFNGTGFINRASFSNSKGLT